MWDCQRKFRINLGPMPLGELERLLPDGDSFLRLIAWVRSYAGDELEWDVRFILKAEEVPQMRLGAYGRLGWSTWLKSMPFADDAHDLILRPMAVGRQTSAQGCN